MKKASSITYLIRISIYLLVKEMRNIKPNWLTLKEASRLVKIN